MAHIRCDFRSEVMDMNTSMTVVLPEGVTISQRPVVYLFHGLADNCSGWSRYTSVERYARGYNAAVVIPEAQRSFYSDMSYGINYFQFIHDELPQICHSLFGVSLEPEKNYVMGLSMGGYAAMKCALNTPERYAGCAAFSSVTDLPARVASQDVLLEKEFTAIFGNDLTVPENCDLLAMAEKHDGKTLPKLYMACGEQDGFFEQNKAFAALLGSKGADILFEHWEGEHNWDFWDAAVCKALKHMLSEA